MLSVNIETMFDLGNQNICWRVAGIHIYASKTILEGTDSLFGSWKNKDRLQISNK